MKVTRIKRIKGHRVFRDFSWPTGLDDFRRFNLIYGWNGSGKTSLSNLFCHLQDRRPVGEASVQFVCDGADVDGAALTTASAVPDVRVFNRDFVATNVSSSSANMQPIFFLGKESVEKQRQVEDKRQKLEDLKFELELAEGGKSVVIGKMDAFTVEKGKAIKVLLSSSGGTNPYNNYDKRSYKQKADALKGAGYSAKLLDESNKENLKKTITSSPKDAIAALTAVIPDAAPFHKQVYETLSQTVVSSVLTELSKDGDVADWVKTGLSLHTRSRATTDCRFCGQTLPAARLKVLEAHFNDEYERFLNALDSLTKEVEQAKKNCQSISRPDKAAFYDTLKSDYEGKAEPLKVHLIKTADFFGALATALVEKRKKPFESLSLDSQLLGLCAPAAADGIAYKNAINELIARHNELTNNFQRAVTDARRVLEESLVAESIEEYKDKGAATVAAEASVASLREQKDRLEQEIIDLEKDIVEHRQPAEELNQELRSYLGRDELKFEVKETGYSVTRGNAPAAELSEGERTAIAFLYFLKSLHDKGFKIADSVVIIDDPVSSLDTNALFAAFGFMKERTKDAGQLIVLTHSFAFFRQVKNWFNHLNRWKKKPEQPARFYMLESSYVDGARNATLKLLDSLLIDFESEYHYLFNKVHKKTAAVAGTPLEEHYEMPNIARRLLEAFLSFRFPNEAGELNRQLERTRTAPATKARIIRFLHTYSHDGKIGDSEHDLSVLAETPAVLREVLDLIKAEDPTHYSEMECLIGIISGDVAVPAATSDVISLSHTP